ncbi:hypothetical protein SAY87_007291 [Trapa incisa]|uniref:Uncharacterized protein n=1 Tax=Trapa incisa TaxID=236973 RepID=A0AAN7K0R9_9MYRT|nr:hypothetical protein SAY87_007291 [Trapa incisa]
MMESEYLNEWSSKEKNVRWTLPIMIFRHFEVGLQNHLQVYHIQRLGGSDEFWSCSSLLWHGVFLWLVLHASKGVKMVGSMWYIYDLSIGCMVHQGVRILY